MRYILKIMPALFFACFFRQGLAYHLYGVILDTNDRPVPYVNIIIEHTTRGVASNLKGEYFLELENGNYAVIFQALGYKKKKVNVTINGQNKKLNIRLQQSDIDLKQVTITSDQKDPAYAIIDRVIENRKKFRKQVNSYRCNTYIKASLEKEYIKKDTSGNRKEEEDTIAHVITKERMNFIESYGQTNFQYPNQYKQIKYGVNNQSDQNRGSVNVSLSFSNDEDEYYEMDFVNRNLFKVDISEADFNFYYNNIDVPSLGPVPFISPINPLYAISYKFRLVETFLENGMWINNIEVIPRRADAALFKGNIYIVQEQWNIKAVNFEIDPSSLYLFRYFKIIQEYSNIEATVWMITREEFLYNSKEGKKTILGNTIIVNSDYELNTDFPKRFFQNEISSALDDAYDRDTNYWKNLRPVTLKNDELEFIRIQDSIKEYHESENYLKEQDSIFNHIDVWDFLLNGLAFRNRLKKRTIYFNPLIASMYFMGIGGYRHAFGGSYEKEWSKSNEIKIDYLLNYGFNNKDLKGSLGASYLYQPKRLGRIHGEYRNTYEMINNYEAVSAIFSRGNYVNDIFYSFGHEMEFANGLFVDFTAEYGEKRPINQLKIEKWSDNLFGELNTPKSFNPYTEFVLDIIVKYTFKNQYRTEPFKKINLGSKYPTLKINYKRGIPKILNSIVDFDFIEINLKDDFKIGTMGISRWNLYVGKYVTGNTVQFAEYKFFRGSDHYLYSNPLKSFQQLGPSISTKNEYLQAHYLHNFNGTLLNKIPLIKKLGLLEVGGGGILLIKDNNYSHAEIYSGLEFPFRIRKQLLKIGVYYVTSYSSQSKISGEFKFGIDFFNSFTNSWSH